jgi:hypothetical protein
VAQIFPEWTNRLPAFSAGALALFLAGIIGFFWYYGSPKYTDVGYRPTQPVPYSHKLHAGDLDLDCRYCHNLVEASPEANVPPTKTCMNCHTLILPQSEKLLPIRESFADRTPMRWVRVHKLADFVYFNHSAHLSAGVGCADCHGNVAEMEKVTQVQPLSMSWCLDCHRQPETHLRLREELTNMKWTPPVDQADFARRLIEEKHINPPTDCSGCHR